MNKVKEDRNEEAPTGQRLRNTENQLRQNLADTVSSAAVWAMINEAAVTPKPGLVDRANAGAHKDMDFFTLIDSALALLYWFRDCALAGFDSEVGEKSETTPKALFEALRLKGKAAETMMEKTTGGVNTHRGYIFCLGLLSAAYGRLRGKMERPDLTGVIEFSKAMTRDIGEDFSRLSEKEKLSHGEAVYTKSGIHGIRGEASSGFPSVIEYALPLLHRLLNQGCSLNDAGVAILLNLMAHVEDTNIIHRGGIAALRSIQEDTRRFLASVPETEAIIAKASVMDREFISKNLSPGGSADLLGITLFLYRLELV